MRSKQIHATISWLFNSTLLVSICGCPLCPQCTSTKSTRPLVLSHCQGAVSCTSGRRATFEDRRIYPVCSNCLGAKKWLASLHGRRRANCHWVAVSRSNPMALLLFTSSEWQLQ